ncbi:alpha-isopropylmalate synthase regulatory domain-containing protein [Terrisporobacter sp.]|uniref:alpha-isopropylmalate synthase regulatory domain-containing protein n=2 Tax=Terrisporobacter TaxID=1505652 RepID=UPI001A8D6CB8|nr:alpha-isopropylmalate synthase regulatory domain-containing protein [Terrisporobacter sp.]MBN9645401.1 hypothetical protein [Terrisporobacter glycolicus]
MENEYGFNIPKNMHKYICRVVKQASDIYHIKNCAENNMLELEAVINFEGEDYVIKGKVNGPIDAFNNALKQNELKNYKFKNYHEHALSKCS